PRPEGDGDGQTGHDERRNGSDGLPDVEGLGKGSPKQGAVGPHRIITGQHHEDGPHQHSQQNRNDGQKQRRLPIGANKEIHDFAPSPFPPAIMSPNSSSVTVSGSTQPTIFPSQMMAIRSLSFMISSRSREISSTAFPLSRCSISRRWMNSMAPTSSPRVGWAAINRSGS